MGDIRMPQNPGIGGLDELTSEEEAFVQNITGLTYAQGDILYYDGSNLTNLGAGTSGQFLKTQGAGANPIWDDASSSSGATTALDNLASVAINTDLLLGTSDGGALGSSSKMWSDLFLASGAVINFNAGNVTLTHSAGVLTLGGTSTLALGSNSLTMTGSIAATGARVTKGWFTDLEVTNAPTVGGTALYGVGNAFFAVSGPTTSTKTFTFPNASSTMLYSGGALGTPSSGTLTNATGLPIAGLVASTSTAIGVGSIELGHASDTTITRVSAGVVSIEGDTIQTLAANQTATGQKKFNNIIDVNNAITATSNAATVPVTYRLSTVTNNSAATLTITMTTTSAVDGQMTIVRIYDFSAVAQTISWVNTENSSVTAPTTSNGSTTLPLTVGFMYNGATSKWRCIAST